MDLWNKVSGILRIELTCADPGRLLDGALGKNLTLHEVQILEGIRILCTVSRKDFSAMKALAKKQGASLRILERKGLCYRAAAWAKRPVILAVLLLLLLASGYLPGRILFVQVSGNTNVPTRLILETAGEFGLGFGASRRAVRSERIKNELLGAIEELEWVGVNTSGSVATISVRERKPEPEPEREKICNLVAACDGVIERVYLIRGDLKCTLGQAVRQGEILVSGYLDLGICVKTLEAEGEVYARTLRQISAVIPQTRSVRVSEGEKIIKYSLLLGKKRINLYSDSGILMPTCGKMTKVYQLRLPGGFTLPAALIQEVYTVYETQPKSVAEEEALSMLSAAMERVLQRNMVAGTVLDSKSKLEAPKQNWIMTASYECREMIARQDEGVYLQDYG